MEITELKDKINKIIARWVHLQSGDDRISQLENRSTEFTQFEQQRGNRPNEIDRHTEIYGVMTKELTFSSLETQKKREKSVGLKKHSKN